jgi:hypothetical protein
MDWSKAGLILRQMVNAPTRRQWRWLTVLAAVGPVGLFLMAIFDLYALRGDTGRMYGFVASIYCLLALGTGISLLRLIRRSSSIATADDRAGWSYGASFEELSAMERDRVRYQMRQELRADGKASDEREAAMQRDAEGRAFRLLRRGLPGLVTVYWIVSLCLPNRPVRMGLVFSAVAVSGLTMVVLALPELIRMWRVPEDAGEPRLVMGTPKGV